mgnify:CR=1 FL=1
MALFETLVPNSIVQQVTLLLGLLTFLSVIVLSLVWLERKYLGRLQMRMGPMRVGPYGLLQPVADALKLVVWLNSTSEEKSGKENLRSGNNPPVRELLRSRASTGKVVIRL